MVSDIKCFFGDCKQTFYVFSNFNISALNCNFSIHLVFEEIKHYDSNAEMSLCILSLFTLFTSKSWNTLCVFDMCVIRFKQLFAGESEVLYRNLLLLSV